MNNIESGRHVTGKSVYLDDIPVLQNTLYAVVCGSAIAHGRIKNINTAAAAALPGVIRVFTYADVPCVNEIGGIIADEPLFAEGEVHFSGQPVALVVAVDEHTARKAAKRIIVDAEPLEVITDPRVAKERGQLLIPPRTFRMGSIADSWAGCDYIFEGRADSGGQEHLYIETQGAYAFITDSGSLKVHSSTQGPTAVQKTIARVLGMPMNNIEVDVARLGGGFGGKEDQATGFAVMAAMAAHLLQRPVKLSLHRIDDMKMTGKRHPYSTDFKIGLTKDYRITAFKATMYQNGGAAADLSPAIMERTLFHSTNCYFIPNTEVTVYSCRTNLPPNTAFRGFGAPQGIFAIESAIAMAAEKLKVPARVIQLKNFIRDNDLFQYGQTASGVKISECFEEAQRKFDIEAIEESVKQFNATSRLIKRGMALMPICFGISFTNTMMNQARALVHIYQDGSISISTGAVEMGQGVNTKLAQVAAALFSVSTGRIRVATTNTSRVANTSPTAASSGADLNGNALVIACSSLLTRLRNVAATNLGCNADEITIRDEVVYKGGTPSGLTWDSLVKTAFQSRVSLSEIGHYATPGIFFDKTKEKGNPFAYHVWGAAVITATVDCLRGTYTIDDVLIVHDFGNSLNPVIDKGQIEGGVLQGLGWMTMEEISFSNDGRLLSGTLSTYKVPDIYSAPANLVCHALETDGPGLAIMKSKAVGEPPLLYGIGAYFAIANAIREYNPAFSPDFNTPLTPEKVLMRLHRSNKKD